MSSRARRDPANSHPEAGVRQRWHGHGSQLELDLGWRSGAGVDACRPRLTARVKPLARIVAQATHAQTPPWFTTAPVGAIRDSRQGSVGSRDCRSLRDQRSVRRGRDGGDARSRAAARQGQSCMAAHARSASIGASGARIVATLLAALKQRGLKRGVASLCIGGGEATALAVETDRLLGGRVAQRQRPLGSSGSSFEELAGYSQSGGRWRLGVRLRYHRLGFSPNRCRSWRKERSP